MLSDSNDKTLSPHKGEARFDSENYPVPLVATEALAHSRMFGGASPSLIKAVTTENITMNNHGEITCSRHIYTQASPLTPPLVGATFWLSAFSPLSALLNLSDDWSAQVPVWPRLISWRSWAELSRCSQRTSTAPAGPLCPASRPSRTPSVSSPSPERIAFFFWFCSSLASFVSHGFVICLPIPRVRLQMARSGTQRRVSATPLCPLFSMLSTNREGRDQGRF